MLSADEREQLADDTVLFVDDRRNVSFHEILEFLQHHMEVSGDQVWVVPGHYLWAHMSEEALSFLTSLVDEGRLFIHPCTELEGFLIYVHDGGVPAEQLEVLDTNTGEAKNLEWLPVRFNTYPHPLANVA